MKRSLNDLMKQLDISFDDKTLLEIALRHRSVGRPNNERLEFLGDSILNFIIADTLFKLFPNASEGQLTRLRASLVNKQSLAELALTLQLDDIIELGVGEKKSGGFKRASILADALEAILAAIYLDQGVETLRRVLDVLYEDKLAELSLKKINKDPKTKLQECLQASRQPLPTYCVLKSENRGHDSQFVIQCQVMGLEPTLGEGTSRRAAEQEAAQMALEILNGSS